jgi:hypothetical protein
VKEENMADYFPAQIRIGGAIPHTLTDQLAKVIAHAGVSWEWGGSDFSPQTACDLATGIAPQTKLLQLYDLQARYGWFEKLEGWLAEHDIPFDRQSDTRYEFDGQAVSFRPGIGTITYCATQDGGATVPAELLKPVRAFLREALTESSPEKVRAVLITLDEALGPEIPALLPFSIID